MHFFHWLDKPYAEGELDRDGTKLFQLICGKCYDFVNDFQSLIAGDNSKELLDAIAVLDLTPDDHSFLRDLASSVACMHLCEFEHRIVNACIGDPWYALKLVQTKDVTTGCYTRQSIARRILDTPDEQLTVNLVKWKRRHAQDLQLACRARVRQA